MSVGIDFQEYVKPHAVYYAELNTVLYNVKFNLKESLVTAQPIIYSEAFNQYLDLFGDKYQMFKIPQEKINKMKEKLKEEKKNKN
jgi:hypothetical protein